MISALWDESDKEISFYHFPVRYEITREECKALTTTLRRKGITHRIIKGWKGARLIDYQEIYNNRIGFCIIYFTGEEYENICSICKTIHIKPIIYITCVIDEVLKQQQDNFHY